MHTGNQSSFLTKQLPILLFLLVLALGIYTRVANSAGVSLCMDESWRISCLLDADDLKEQLLVGMNRTDPIFFNLAIYLLGKLYNTELVLRLAAIIPGILALPLVYLVGRRLFNSRWLALLATFLTVFSAEMMVFAKELKPYSLCAFVHLCLLYGYLRYRDRIDVRSTIAFTALLAVSIPLSLHSTFAFPGLFLALFALVIRSRNWKQAVLVLASAVFLLLFALICFHLLFGGVEDEGQLKGMKSYWAGHFPPTESLTEMISWLFPRYVEHYRDIGYTNRLASGFLQENLLYIYLSMALMGFLALLFRNRRRFFEACCLFLLPLVVMAVFSLLQLWPFGRERMNLFIFVYVLYPPLILLDELGRTAARRLVPLVVGVLICIQFPIPWMSFAGSRVVGCWQSNEQALQHLLDSYPAGPRIPLVTNYLGQAQFNYYSKHHRHAAARYNNQADLFDVRSLISRNSAFYLQGAMIRLLQKNRQVALYMSHYTGGEAIIFDNDFCVEHHGWSGNKARSALLISEIYEAAQQRKPLSGTGRFTGICPAWNQVYRSPLLEIDQAGYGSLLIFNLDVDHHSADRAIRLTVENEAGGTAAFVDPVSEYVNTVDIDRLESAVCFKMRSPPERVRLTIWSKGNFDFTVSNLEYFTVRRSAGELGDRQALMEEEMCERIRLLRSVSATDNFWPGRGERFGWTNGNSRIELEDVIVDPAEQVLVLETHGWLLPEARDKVLGNLKVYLNDIHRAHQFESEKEANTFYFRIPEETESLRSITIKSKTFIPRDYGFNTDSRRLGIDVKFIGLPCIVKEEEGA